MAQSQIIEPKDIRKGDTIKVTNQYNGLTRELTGVAHKQDSDGDWQTEQGGYLYLHMGDSSATVHLVERPQKPLPTFVYPSIIATKVDGIVGRWLLTLDMDGDWGTQSGEDIGGRRWFMPSEIQEWEPHTPLDPFEE